MGMNEQPLPIQIPTMPSPTSEALEHLRDWIGGQLPPSYLDFVARHDGAEPEENSLITSENEVGVRRFIPVREAAALAEKIDSFPARVIPIAEDDCGSYFYVEPATGSVRFWDHEVDGSDEEVASDVSAFVMRLAPFATGKVNLSPGQVKHVWIDPDFLTSLKKDGLA